MPFDTSEFQQMLEQYLANEIELRIVNYIGDQNPIGSGSLGVNIDVGEVNSFDLEINNKGGLGIKNAAVNIAARHGRVSGTFSGTVNLAGSAWMDPWHTVWQTRQFNVGAGQTLLLKHQMSGGLLFGYVADETTGGSDNNRDVETLLTSTFAYWQPDLDNFVLKPHDGPVDTYKNFIQRS